MCAYFDFSFGTFFILNYFSLPFYVLSRPSFETILFASMGVNIAICRTFRFNFEKKNNNKSHETAVAK